MQQRLVYNKIHGVNPEDIKPVLMEKITKPYEDIQQIEGQNGLKEFIGNDNMFLKIVGLGFDTIEKLKTATREDLKSLPPLHKGKIFKLLNI